MKRNILSIAQLLLGLLPVSVAFSQSNEGHIIYEVKMNLHRRIPKEDENMKQMIPEFRTSQEQLIFNQSESYYKPFTEESEVENNASQQGGAIRMIVKEPTVERYTNQLSNEIIVKQELMGKYYLIVDTVKTPTWEFGKATKTILGYNCKQAYYTAIEVEQRPEGPTSEKYEVTAWFTDAIRTKIGPDKFNTLPGTVLAVDINNGERVILATKVDLKALKKNELKRPTQGTITTQKEFRKIENEQLMRMGGNGPTFRRK